MTISPYYIMYLVVRESIKCSIWGTVDCNSTCKRELLIGIEYNKATICKEQSKVLMLHVLMACSAFEECRYSLLLATVYYEFLI